MKTSADHTEESDLGSLIRTYIKAHGGTLPVSVARTALRARAALPNAVISDSELASLIGREAVLAGRAVHFDVKNAWPEFRLDKFA